MVDDIVRKQAADVQNAKEIIARFGDSLPSEVDIAALDVWSKAPYKALVVREALIWRTEELGRVAIECLERHDYAASMILIRSIIENSALVWRLKSILESRSKNDAAKIHEILDKMLMGWKGDPEFPEAFNVLTLVDHLDREVPGVRKSYDSFSEHAHPNYRGVHGLYAKVDYEKFVTHFGRGIRTENTAKMAISALCGSLGLFELAYNKISDIMPVWLSELSPLSGPRDPD